MGKKASLVLVLVVVLLSLSAIGAFAETEYIPKPAIPEFTVKFVDNSYDVAAHNCTDPYSGKITEQSSYHVYNARIDIAIKNQAFTPYILPGDFGPTVHLMYNIRMRGHFGEDWNPLTYQSDGYLSASNSDYTFFSFPWQPHDDPTQADFQVEAMIGYVSHNPAGMGWFFNGTESGWSNIQTITIPGLYPSLPSSPPPASTPDPTTEPTTTPNQVTAPTTNDTSQSPGLEAIIGAVIAVIVSASLLVYFKKHKHTAKLSINR